MPIVYFNAAGTAEVELTIPRNRGEVVKKPLQGCFVKKEANVKHFLEKYIDPSADRNKYERSDYLFYCCVSDFREVVTKAVIKYEKLSKGWGAPTQKTKACTVKQPLIITFDGHFFLCCDSEDLNKSRFLAECSKKVRIDQDLDTRQSFYGIGVEGHCLLFIFLESNKQLQNHVYKVKYKNEFEKLLEVGPLLLGDNKTLVGCYRKTADGNYSIEIDIFGKQGEPDHPPTGSSEDPPPVSLPVGPPGDPEPAALPPEPPRANQQLEHQDPATVTLKFNHLMIEATRCLEDYIARESGTLTDLKDHFRRLLPDEQRTNASSVKELLKALEEHSVIRPNDVRLLKVLAEAIQLRELMEKIEKFEADCPRKVEKPFAVIHLKTVVLVLGVELALAGANLMDVFTTNPDTLQSLWDFGIQLFSSFKGSVIFVLEAPSLSSLKQLWQSYKDGSLKEKLKHAFNEMEELKALSQGEEIDLEVTIDEGEHREVLWDLIQLEVKGKSLKSTKRRQRRHSVSCERDAPEELTVGGLCISGTTYRPSRNTFVSEAGSCKDLKVFFGDKSIAAIDTEEAASKLANFLNLDKTSLVDPPTDIVVKSIQLCSLLKSKQRIDIVERLRGLLPSGMTGPLIDGRILVKDMDYNKKKTLAQALSGRKDEWKVFAQKVGLSTDSIAYYHERKENPVLAILEDYCGNMRVDELYLCIVESGANAIADNYL